MMGLAELKSNQSMRSSLCDNMKERGVMGVAELRCMEFASKSEHYCESGGGQRKGTSLECTVCTAVRSGECGNNMNGPSATILATSRVRGYTFSYTKGGQSEERGGGQTSNIIRRFEERKEKTDVNNIANRSDSSKKISVQNFKNFKNRKLPTNNMTLKKKTYIEPEYPVTNL